MLVVKVEAWKHGDPKQVSPLGVVLIRNDGHVVDGDPDFCFYEITLQGVPRRTGFVKHYRRRGWQVLVRKAIQEVL